MQKDFDKWSEVKKRVEVEPPRLYTVREVWWCYFGLNIGTEQDGKDEWYARPCVILRGFGPQACLVAPLTTSARAHPLRVDVGVIDGEQAKANLSQIRVIDTRRLIRKLEFMNTDIFAKLRKATKDML
jgi:mRNA interferase MazF